MKQSSHLTNEELAELKSLIETKLVGARDIIFEQRRVIEEATEGDRRGYGDSEEAWGAQTINEAKAIIAKQKPYINALENALERIKAGNYGFCLVTGEPIPINRLRLVPHATRCIKAKTVV